MNNVVPMTSPARCVEDDDGETGERRHAGRGSEESGAAAPEVVQADETYGLGPDETPAAFAVAAIIEAFQRRGGAQRLAEWIGEDAQNERVFVSQIFTKLLSAQAKGSEEPASREPRALTWLPPV